MRQAPHAPPETHPFLRKGAFSSAPRTPPPPGASPMLRWGSGLPRRGQTPSLPHELFCEIPLETRRPQDKLVQGQGFDQDRDGGAHFEHTPPRLVEPTTPSNEILLARSVLSARPCAEHLTQQCTCPTRKTQTRVDTASGLPRTSWLAEFGHVTSE